MSTVEQKAGSPNVWEIWDRPWSEPIGYVIKLGSSYRAYLYDDHREVGSRRTLEDAHALVDRRADEADAAERARSARVEAIIAAEAPHKHLFRIRETYSATDRSRFKSGLCACGETATFGVAAP